MIREDIFGGLQIALEKGETLEKAMLSFYNAGYKKEDIEETAKALVNKIPQYSQVSTQNLKPEQKPIPIIKSKQNLAEGMPTQKISNYEQSKSNLSKKSTLILILVIALVVLLGALIGLFIFKNTLIGIFNH